MILMLVMKMKQKSKDWKRIQKSYIDLLSAKIEESSSYNNENFSDIEDRLDKLEDKGPFIVEEVISALWEKKNRENCMIYKLKDSNEALSCDTALFKQLIDSCDKDPPFDIENVKLMRIGKVYKKNFVRPLKITLTSNSDVHWLFHQKNNIHKVSEFENIVITIDLTKEQQDFRRKVSSELKQKQQIVLY